jgi:hypothetical protein
MDAWYDNGGSTEDLQKALIKAFSGYLRIEMAPSEDDEGNAPAPEGASTE